MIELLARTQAVQKAVDTHYGKSIDWKQHDCLRLISTCLQALGHPSPLKEINNYSGEKTALIALRKSGFENLADALLSKGFQEIAPAEALAGDVVVIDAESPWTYALGLALGDGRLIAFANGICDHAPVTVASRAFRTQIGEAV